jgi:hypothetical protein
MSTDHGISPGLVPPTRGLDKEEPDLWQEDDIPTDSRGEHDENWAQAGEPEPQ